VSHDENAEPDKVLRLPAEYEAQPEETPESRPGRLHGALTTGMALSALVGIASMFAFITVGWSESTRGYVLGIFFASVLVFLTCASAAVFTAARDTYAPHSDK
jgi:hypothetical protein